MAGWSYEQNFDSLSTGNLSGQDSWVFVAGAQPQVQGSVFSSSPYAVSGALNSNINTYRDITAVTDDGSICYVSLRVDNVGSVDNMGPRFQQGTTWLGTFYLNAPNAGDIGWRTGLSPFGYTTLGTASANTWYRAGIEFDFTNDRIRVNYDNGTMSSWISTVSMTQVDRIQLEGNNGDGGTTNGYWDDFSASYSTTTPYPVMWFQF